MIVPWRLYPTKRLTFQRENLFYLWKISPMCLVIKCQMLLHLRVGLKTVSTPGTWFGICWHLRHLALPISPN
ncbi:MAG TPA: hypothetical protein DCY35_11555 [Prolixibacteraceae bacterium]|nr:hypothetical protein [Prolixibacteraceae bacterium]